MTTDCLFCKIVAGEIPSTMVYESEKVYAFRDINPQASTHVVLVPRVHHENAASLGSDDPELAGAMLAAAGEIAQAEGVAESGYRLVFNTGPESGQTVFHVHCHVLGGRKMAWPPG